MHSTPEHQYEFSTIRNGRHRGTYTKKTQCTVHAHTQTNLRPGSGPRTPPKRLTGMRMGKIFNWSFDFSGWFPFRPKLPNLFPSLVEDRAPIFDLYLVDSP